MRQKWDKFEVRNYNVFFVIISGWTNKNIKNKKSVDHEGNETTVEGKGRHDPCVVPRAVPIVESMAAIIVLDHLLRAKASGPIQG